MYAWVAVEAGAVKNLRSHLAQHLGMDPKRSELRAYWSLGKAGSGANGIPVKQQAS
jgi:NADPH-dependent ferric siderophore reductase